MRLIIRLGWNRWRYENKISYTKYGMQTVYARTKTRCPYKDIDNEFCPEVELIVDYLEFLEKSFENLQKSFENLQKKS